MSNVVDGGTGTATPIILNASLAGVQIQSSSTPVMMQSSVGGQSSRVGGGGSASGDVMASNVVGSPSSPSHQPVAVVTVTPVVGIMIWSATGTSRHSRPTTVPHSSRRHRR